MKDIVFEWYIPHILDRKQQFIKALTISAAIIFFVDALLFASIMLLPALAIAVGGFFLFRSWKYEYEYVYVNGDFTISKIIRKAKRKDVYHTTRTEITEFIKKQPSQEKTDEKGNKITDFTSGRPGAPVYQLKARGETVYIEPASEFVDELSKYRRTGAV